MSLRSVISRPMAEAEFAVTYAGPALTEGRMPVADLAPSLLALSELFTEASRVSYPEREPASLNIRADTERGSFLVWLAVQSPGAWDEVRDLLSGAAITALVNLQGVIFGEGGILWLLKTLGGRRIIAREQLPSGRFRLTLPDGAVYESSAEAVDLYDRPSARQKARRIVEPLRQQGIDRVEFTTDDHPDPVLEVGEADLPGYEELPEGILGEREEEVIVTLVTASVEGKYKWRFTEGDPARFTASMEDPEFRAKIDAHAISFQKDDKFRVDMRTVQSEVDGKLHAERTVVRVLEVYPRAEQTSIEINDDT